VVGWPAFWWLDHYDAFACHVRMNACEVLADDCLAIYDLRVA
jgi:hypothetical protein